jgi:drug/metabolite transporter (DMT)-like permease
LLDADERLGTLSAVAVAVIWGLSFVAARLVLSTLTPVLLATLRFIIASIVFTPIIMMEFGRGSTLKIEDLKELALLGVLSISVYFWLQYTGIKYAGAGVSALLVVGLIPILIGFASMIVLREKLTPYKALGTALGLLGVALIALPGLLIEEVDWFFYFGVVCLLLNGVCWATYSTLSRRLMKRLGRPALVTSYVTVLGTMALIPMSVTSEWALVWSLAPIQWVSVLYLAVVCSGLGYFLWNFALSRLEAVKAAVWLYLEPVAAFVGEIVIFGTMPSSTTFLGGLIIIIGAYITNRSGD